MIFSVSRVNNGFSVNDGDDDDDELDELIGSEDRASPREASLLSACERCFCSSEATRCWMMSSRFLAREESVSGLFCRVLTRDSEKRTGWSLASKG